MKLLVLENYSTSPEKLKTSAPSFSMSGRHDLKQNYTDSPGPGAYTSSPPKLEKLLQ